MKMKELKKKNKIIGKQARNLTQIIEKSLDLCSWQEKFGIDDDEVETFLDMCWYDIKKIMKGLYENRNSI